MILADSSIWIDHLRRTDPELDRLLGLGEVIVHPFVIGELACGTLRHRSLVLAWIAELPTARGATHREVLALIERHGLFGRGVGWIDAHLLASTLLEAPATLWTRDRRLATAASELACLHAPKR